MSLKEYTRKRDFRKTAEPRAGRAKSGGGHRFVIQKHAASRLHYDFRLELDGTLKSWAVPKGVPFKKGERRLAVHVEDHPVGYIDFEGTIPAGQYGGGTVMVWDTGTFEPLSEDPVHELEHGKLHFVLHGRKLEGEWYLVQLRGGDEWLLIKGGADQKPVSAKADDTSAISRRSMAAIAKAGDRVWGSTRAAAPSPTSDRSFSRNRSRSPSSSEPTAKPVGRELARAKPAGRNVAHAKTVAHAVARVSSVGRELARATKPRQFPAAEPPVRLPARRAPRRRAAFIEPMKALLVDAPPPGEWLYEIKFDGFRALAFRHGNETRLLSRNNKDLAGKFPEVAAAVSTLDVRDAVIDGEIVALDAQGRSSFQLLQAYDLGTERPPMLFYAFDLLRRDGRDLQALPLTERRAQLEALLHGHEGIVRYSAALAGGIDALLAQAQQLGLEGLIGKRPDSRYEPGGRSGAWIKLKLHQEQEFVIGGYTPPGGSRQHLGALLVGYYAAGQLKFAGKVGTGFNAKRLAELAARFAPLATGTCPFADLPEKRSGRYGQGLTDAEMRRCHWVRPELVAQVRFAEWTRDERLRQPVFLGLREDKSAREVVREKA